MRILKILVVAFVAQWLTVTAHAVTLPGPLVETDWLAKHARQVVILDVRANVKSFTGKPAWVTDKKTRKKKLARVAGHIPGALFVDYKKVRVKTKVGNNKLTGMLPGKAVFEKFMQNSGLNKGSSIVIVSEGNNNLDMTMATRLYWQLKYFGQDNMAILNGGMGQWITDGHQVASGAVKVKKGNWQASAERREILATSAEVAAAVKDKSAQLMDTRPLSLYLGTWRKKSYVYANGHIPGAKSFPNELLTMPKTPARFIATKQLKSMVEQMGLDPSARTISYCNSGHLATGSWFVMSELLGNKNAKMYDGSMNQWTIEKHPTVSMKME